MCDSVAEMLQSHCIKGHSVTHMLKQAVGNLLRTYLCSCSILAKSRMFVCKCVKCIFKKTFSKKMYPNSNWEVTVVSH